MSGKRNIHFSFIEEKTTYQKHFLATYYTKEATRCVQLTTPFFTSKKLPMQLGDTRAAVLWSLLEALSLAPQKSCPS